METGVELEFAHAQEGDLTDLLAMMRAFYAIDAYPFDEAIARAALLRLIREPSLGSVWIIRADGHLAGYVVLTLGFSLEFHGRDAFVDELFLLPALRHRGIGTRALRFVEEQCRELGVQALHLEVERGNATAQRLYRGLGFRNHDRYLMTKWIAE
jgi:ribosomal protein S18 acetylase RimI-like enzyme